MWVLRQYIWFQISIYLVYHILTLVLVVLHGISYFDISSCSYGTFATGGCDGYVNVWDGNNKKRLYQVEDARPDF